MALIALAAGLPACGKTRDVLNGRGGDGAANGRDGGEDSGAGRPGTGSGGASGATANSGGKAGSTGGNVNGGGTAAVGTTAGDAGSTGSGGVNPLDPHAAERKELIRQLCDQLTQYPCLDYYPQRSEPVQGLAQQVELCNQDTDVVTYAVVQSGCFEAWAAAARCLLAHPQQCPCMGNDCLITAPGLMSARCPAESQALLDCMGSQPPVSGEVSGSLGQCGWYEGPSGPCGVDCVRDAQHTYSAKCDGAPNGPQVCYCELNAVPLHDGTLDSPGYRGGLLRGRLCCRRQEDGGRAMRPHHGLLLHVVSEGRRRATHSVRVRLGSRVAPRFVV